MIQNSRNPMPKMKQQQCIIQTWLPDDISLKIASFLGETEVCALECCSRFWRKLCGSDCIWEALTSQRWPLLSPSDKQSCSTKGWKGFYMKQHGEMEKGACDVVKNVEQRTRLDSLEVGDYLQAIEELSAVKLGFKDVKMFLFRPKLNVLVNLIGLHYCILGLNVPREDVMEALESCKISERKVCVRWWKLGRLLYGFRMRDEAHCHWVSLADLAMAKEEQVLGVLRRGAIHEVLRVQIYFVNPTCSAWSHQST